ncbi:hypothetical protein D3C87_2107170 [compost metagenome]
MRDFLHEAVELGGRGLIEACLFLKSQESDRLQQPQGAEGIHIRRVLGGFE